MLSSGFLPAASALEARRQSVTGAIQGRVGRHEVESAAAGSHSRVPLGAGPPPTRSLRGPTRRVARSHWDLRALPRGASPGPTGSASGTFKARLEKRVGAPGARLPRPTGTLAVGEAPHRRVPLAGARRPPRAPTGRPRHYRARRPLPLGYLPTLLIGEKEERSFFFSSSSFFLLKSKYFTLLTSFTDLLLLGEKGTGDIQRTQTDSCGSRRARPQR